MSTDRLPESNSLNITGTKSSNSEGSFFKAFLGKRALIEERKKNILRMCYMTDNLTEAASYFKDPENLLFFFQHFDARAVVEKNGNLASIFTRTPALKLMKDLPRSQFYRWCLQYRIDAIDPFFDVGFHPNHPLPPDTPFYSITPLSYAVNIGKVSAVEQMVARTLERCADGDPSAARDLKEALKRAETHHKNQQLATSAQILNMLHEAHASITAPESNETKTPEPLQLLARKWLLGTNAEMISKDEHEKIVARLEHSVDELSTQAKTSQTIIQSLAVQLQQTQEQSKRLSDELESAKSEIERLHSASAQMLNQTHSTERPKPSLPVPGLKR